MLDLRGDLLPKSFGLIYLIYLSITRRFFKREVAVDGKSGKVDDFVKGPFL